MVETKSSMPWVLYGFCCCNHVEIVETVQPRGGWIRDMKVKETFEALFSWYYFEITDLTWLLNNYYLITCNMSSLDMSCLNPWPFHPLTNALLNGFFFSLNKSLLLTPENTAKKETCGFWVGIPTNCGAWGLPTNCWCLLPSLSRPCQNRSSSPPDLPAPSRQTPGPNWSGLGKPPPPWK